MGQGVLIMAVDQLMRCVATYLTKYENLETETQHENRLIHRLFALSEKMIFLKKMTCLHVIHQVTCVIALYNKMPFGMQVTYVLSPGHTCVVVYLLVCSGNVPDQT